MTPPRDRPRLKGGPVRAGTGGRIVTRRSEVLSEAAIARLFAIGEVLSEGGLRDGDGTYFGSTMWTVDLAALGEGWRGLLGDARERARLLHAVEGSVRVRLRLLRMARTEMRRRLPRVEPGTMVAETRFRIVGGKLQADVDVEAPVGVSSSRRRREG